MKNLLIDLCLVFLVIYVGDSLFNHHSMNQLMFSQSIERFEEDISQENILEDRYLITKEDHENDIALLVGKVSQGCIDMIRYVVLWISETISLMAS